MSVHTLTINKNWPIEKKTPSNQPYTHIAHLPVIRSPGSAHSAFWVRRRVCANSSHLRKCYIFFIILFYDFFLVEKPKGANQVQSWAVRWAFTAWKKKLLPTQSLRRKIASHKMWFYFVYDVLDMQMQEETNKTKSTACRVPQVYLIGISNLLRKTLRALWATNYRHMSCELAQSRKSEQPQLLDDYMSHSTLKAYPSLCHRYIRHIYIGNCDWHNFRLRFCL